MMCEKAGCERRTKEGVTVCSIHQTEISIPDPSDAICPECGEQGAGTIHNQLWYCLDKHGFDGCGEFFNPADVYDNG